MKRSSQLQTCIMITQLLSHQYLCCHSLVFRLKAEIINSLEHFSQAPICLSYIFPSKICIFSISFTPKQQRKLAVCLIDWRIGDRLSTAVRVNLITIILCTRLFFNWLRIFRDSVENWEYTHFFRFLSSQHPKFTSAEEIKLGWF